MAVSETTLIEAGIQVGLVSAETVRTLRLTAKRERLRLMEVVTREGRFPEAALYQALAQVRGLPFFQPAGLTPDMEALEQIPRNLLQQRLMIPLKIHGERILVLSDPDDRLSMERVERVVGDYFKPGLADPEALKIALGKYRDEIRGGASAGSGSDEHDPVMLLDNVMKEAYLRRASDIHYEPREKGMRIRMRIDGRMQEYPLSLSPADEEALLNRIKVLAGLDIAEQRMAQDGAMKYTIMNWTVGETDIRVATIPTRWGERCTMRILGQETGHLTLEQLGMPETILREFRRGIERPHGMILVTGPTGSGKSTTLYAAIRELSVDDLNVLTVEDPVEQTIDGVSQVQVSRKVGFAHALRSFLRHDPDVILVGEIRDRETTEIGLRSAMTGHLVLSTLHTNDSVGAVTRLADIGAERFLIGSTLIGVMAQRLVRKLCVHCRQSRQAQAFEIRSLMLSPEQNIQIFEPVGCSFCLGTGYHGRIGVFEALWIDRELAMAISEGAGERKIRAMAPGLKTLWEDARDKVLSGDVSLDDVMHLRPEEH